MFKPFWDNKTKKGNKNKKYSNRESGRRNPDSNGDSMHKVICDTCGQPCEVPFKPTSGKPIYCHDCFKKDGTGPKRPGRPHLQRVPGNTSQDQLKKINDKLDKILKILNS